MEQSQDIEVGNGMTINEMRISNGSIYDDVQQGLCTGRKVFSIRINGRRYRQYVKGIDSEKILRRMFNEWVNNLEKQLSSTSLENAIEKYLKSGKYIKRSEYMKKHIFSMLVNFHDYCKDVKKISVINDVTPHLVEDYIVYRKDFSLYKNRKTKNKITDATLNRVLSAISGLFKWCIEDGCFKGKNPTVKKQIKERNDRPIHVSAEQLEELFSKANPIQEKIFQLLLGTGVRVRSEACNLEWNMVDLKNGSVTVWSCDSKTKESRIIPIPPKLVTILKKLRVQEPNAVYVLEKNGKKMNYYQVRREWIKLRDQISCRLQKGSNLRIHDFRHIYATHLDRMGVATSKIQKLLGHKHLQTTLRYINADGKVEQEAVMSLDDILPTAKKRRR